MKKLNKKGFTIVELVIVIAVIAILAAVLIPTFASVTRKAQESAATQRAAALYKEVLALDLADGAQDGKEGETAITKEAVDEEFDENEEFTYTVAEDGTVTFEYTAKNGKKVKRTTEGSFVIVTETETETETPVDGSEDGNN